MHRLFTLLVLLGALAAAPSACAQCEAGPEDVAGRLVEAVHPLRPEPSVLKVDHMTAAAVAPLIRAELTRRGYRGGRVLIRFFDFLRVREVLASGTDRGPTSRVPVIPRWDADPATRAAHGITPGRLSFLVDVDLDRPGAPISYGPDPTLPEDHTLADFFGETHLGGLDKTTDDFRHSALAVYARDGLVRAPIGDRPRAAGAEFWFKGDPRESLLLVVEK